MCEAQDSRASSPREEERPRTPAILMSERDERFLQSLFEFVEHEKLNLQSPEQGPDQTRYTIYRSVFNQVLTETIKGTLRHVCFTAET